MKGSLSMQFSFFHFFIFINSFLFGKSTLAWEFQEGIIFRTEITREKKLCLASLAKSLAVFPWAEEMLSSRLFFFFSIISIFKYNMNSFFPEHFILHVHWAAIIFLRKRFHKKTNEITELHQSVLCPCLFVFKTPILGQLSSTVFSSKLL